MNNTKYCPMVAREPECIKEKCAWWFKEIDACAVIVIAWMAYYSSKLYKEY